MRASVMRASLQNTNESKGNKSKRDETKLVDGRKTLNVTNVGGNGQKMVKRWW